MKTLYIRKSKLAIVSLILSIIGIVSLVFFIVNPICRHYGPIIAFVAIVSGHFAIRKIKKKPDLSGKYLAFVGLFISYINLLMVGVLLIFFHYYREALYDNYRKYNLETVVLYCKDYITKNNGNIPKDLSNLIIESEGTPHILVSTVAKDRTKLSYKLNVNGNINDYLDKSNTIMIIEVTPNKRGDKIVAFLDGRIEIIDYNKFSQLTNANNKVKIRTNIK